MISIGTQDLETVTQLESIVESVQGHPDYEEPQAFALGLARVAITGQVLDVKFPTVNRAENPKTAAILAGSTDNFELIDDNGLFIDRADAGSQIAAAFAPLTRDRKPYPIIDAMNAIFGVKSAHPKRYFCEPVLALVRDFDQAPKNTVEAWLRLHLLSTRKAQPQQINMDGVFGLMTNVAWTSQGPMLPDDVGKVRAALMLQDKDLTAKGVDRFPQMLDYVAPPSGVRIADASRVRLGAHLAVGTTVMHEGFVNYNAGTLGKAMVEGRISAGVVVGDNSDIGGGASIMGTLSGGGKEVISIGENCLLGANSGVGISLGNDCVVEAGLYVTAGTKVKYEDQVVKASELSGASGLLFIRDSQSGEVTAKPSERGKVELNQALHAN